MEHARSARVGRTTLLTFAALCWGTAIGNGWSPLPDIDSSAVQAFAMVLVPVLMGGLPLYNIRLAVRDARVLESTGSWSVMNGFRWLITLANVIINFILIALAIFFGAMLITGPAVA